MRYFWCETQHLLNLGKFIPNNIMKSRILSTQRSISQPDILQKRTWDKSRFYVWGRIWRRKTSFPLRCLGLPIHHRKLCSNKMEAGVVEVPKGV
jgi:hypothetical protein